jgi:hypothetical protein
MRQINVRVEDQIAEAFYGFCRRLEMKPTVLLSSIIDFYGRSEILTRKVEEKKVTKDEALIELGRIVADMRNFAKANGEFKEALGDMLQPHGINIEQLGVI